ncbi:MAG: RloB family protein [Burkholderiales bacterium]|nr:RloB family protein [Burkholderiales bacterium]
MPPLVDLEDYQDYDKHSENLETKTIYLFCEGEKREYQYFNQFKKKCNINVEIFDWKQYNKQDPENNKITNSPQGLLEIAKKLTKPSVGNPNVRYEVLDEDEVWLVFDTDRDKMDTRRLQITALRNYCNEQNNWNHAQSNPSIEVWFYYHIFDIPPILANINSAQEWKTTLNAEINGGFDSKKYYTFVHNAIKHAQINFKVNHKNQEPEPSSTEMFKLALKICELLNQKSIEPLDIT